MSDFLVSSLSIMADTSGAITTMRDYVAPTIRTLSSLAAIVFTFLVVNAGYLYMTSSGQPDKLEHAKHVLRNAVIGLVIVLSAATITSILTHAYGSPHSVTSAALPSLKPIQPDAVGNGLIDVLIKAVTGFLNNIIQAVAAPFLGALGYFTQGTPLMAENPSVFNLWLTIVGITDVLFAVILALIGLHFMSASSLGLGEVEFKHLLPRVGLAFLLINTSIFTIDAIIELSNVLIAAIGKVSGASTVWEVLTLVVKDAGGQGLAGLLMMLAFLIFAVILLVYYVGRLVTLFIGAVISPLVILVWLIPGFRDFSETAIKTYLTTIFTLFVHVVILLLAASLLVGMSAGSGNGVPDTLMSMVVGLATVLALLKTQSVMMQFSYVSMGARNARMLGGQFMNGVSYLTGKGRAAATTAASTSSNVRRTRAINRIEQRAIQSGKPQSATIRNKKTGSEINVTAKPSVSPSAKPKKTGATYEAPKVTPVNLSSSKSKSKAKDNT